MNYKNWLFEFEDNTIKFYQNIILSKLELDKEGLSQSLNIWDPEKLISKINELGEYKNLSDPIRKRIENQIKSKFGTIGDIIRLMAN